MNEENENNQVAQELYEGIISMFDEQGYRYTREDENLLVRCTLKGEDIPMDFIFVVRADKKVIQVYSPLPFTISEDKRSDIALALTYINDHLVNGSFDMDLSEGRICFRQTTCYIDSILGKGLFEYMLMVSAHTTDDYNDKILMIEKGMLTVEQFIESEEKNNA